MEKAKEGSELRLEYREQAIDLMAELLRHKMFHRSVRTLETGHFQEDIGRQKLED